jgi:hypothetical protein
MLVGIYASFLRLTFNIITITTLLSLFLLQITSPLTSCAVLRRCDYLSIHRITVQCSPILPNLRFSKCCENNNFTLREPKNISSDAQIN